MLKLSSFILISSLLVLVNCEIFNLDKFIYGGRAGDTPPFTYGRDDPAGPSRWGENHSKCNGLRQSPVNIVTSNPKRLSSQLKIAGYALLPQSVRVQNNGHSMAVELNYLDETKVYFEGGPLEGKGRYIVDNIHWHWGVGNNNLGSEHAFDGRKFAAEAHIVAYHEKFKSASEAMAQNDSLAVLGIVYEYTDEPTENFFTTYANNVLKYNAFYETNTMMIFSLRDLIRKPTWEIYSYQGSLTTPPCHETVTFMILKEPMKVNTADLNNLRKIQDKREITMQETSRPLQSLNGRTFSISNANFCN